MMRISKMGNVYFTIINAQITFCYLLARRLLPLNSYSLKKKKKKALSFEL